MIHDIILTNQQFHDVNPLLCGTENCAKSHRYGPAARDYYLIHFILSGKGTFKTPNGFFHLSKGDLFIIHPGVTSCYEADAEHPWNYVWIGFDLAPERYSQLEFLHSDALYGTSCEPIFQSMLQAKDCSSPELFLCAKLYELFSLLGEASAPIKGENQPRTYVARAQNFIATNYMKEIHVQSIADDLGIDRRYFSSIFKQETGESPQQYLVNLRLKKAAHLLTVNRYTPSEAALNTGYHDIFNFSKMFKQKFGLSPLNYQKQHQAL